MQFLKFLVVGALNTLFGYSVFAGLILLGVPPTPALLLTYVVGVFFNFASTRRFVFNRPGRAPLLRFVLAYVAIYFFNMVLYRIVETSGMVSPLVAQALCLPVVATFSFLVFKFQVFKDVS